MSFDSLVERLGAQPFFDLASVIQLFLEDRSTVRTQLARWAKAGKLLSLRRGLYTLATRYRRVPIQPAELANYLHRPSYLTGVWALGFYGLIPEMVVAYTSVTIRVPRQFENALGVFEYRHIKPTAFFGYRAMEIGQRKVIIAEPEKALLDFWHLARGPWTADRMVEMRFQNRDRINRIKLADYTARFDSPRLRRAAEVWGEATAREEEGTIEL